MPSFIASLLLVPLTAQLARRLTGDAVAGIIAALFVAVAPLAIQFSATAFSDPLLTFWLMAALCAITTTGRTKQLWRSDPLIAGIFFGLAVATKYQAILFAPLMLGIGWLHGLSRSGWQRVLAGFVPVLVLFLLWQASRAAEGDIFLRQWANIGGIRPARSWELWPRLGETATLWRVAVGWPLILAALSATTGWLLATRRHKPALPALFLLAVFIASYTLLHWVWAVPVWDRYLLPILPLIAVLVGGGLTAAWSFSDSRFWRYALTGGLVLLAAMHISTATAARAGRWPIGGRPAADGGAAAVARLLKDAPYGTVLYDHWYSWHWHYQLFDAKVYVSWFPHTDALVDDLAVFATSDSPRFVVLPASLSAQPVIRRLRENGYDVEPLNGQDETASIVLYRITVEKAE